MDDDTDSCTVCCADAELFFQVLHPAHTVADRTRHDSLLSMGSRSLAVQGLTMSCRSTALDFCWRATQLSRSASLWLSEAMSAKQSCREMLRMRMLRMFSALFSDFLEKSGNHNHNPAMPGQCSGKGNALRSVLTVGSRKLRPERLTLRFEGRSTRPGLPWSQLPKQFAWLSGAYWRIPSHANTQLKQQ